MSWCSSSYTTDINFQKISFWLQSKKSYIQKEIDKTLYPEIIIYQESWSKDTDTFINSLIIKSQDNITLNTKEFANQNISTLKSSIGWIEIKSTSTLSFNCSWEKIVWIIKTFKITENNKDNYFSQFFFIENKKWYIISFESDNQDDNSDFKNSLNKLYCTK